MANKPTIHELEDLLTDSETHVEIKPDGSVITFNYMEALELAWGLIANAYGGDWDSAPTDWKEAAERWRDEQWHEALGLMPTHDSPIVTDQPGLAKNDD